MADGCRAGTDTLGGALGVLVFRYSLVFNVNVGFFGRQGRGVRAVEAG